MKPLRQRVLRVFLRVVLLAGVSYVVFLGYIGWKTVLGLKQVRNCANLQTLMWTVESFREKTGHYPVSIAQAVEASSMRTNSKKLFSAGIDAWGNPYLYQVRGDRFILVSYGRDGVAEPRDYWREDATMGDSAACRDLGADIFANRSGVVRCCGK